MFILQEPHSRELLSIFRNHQSYCSHLEVFLRFVVCYDTLENLLNKIPLKNSINSKVIIYFINKNFSQPDFIQVCQVNPRDHLT